MGPDRNSAALMIPASLSVRCGVRGIRIWGISPSGTLMAGPPCDDILAAMVEYPNIKWIDKIVDHDRNMCLRFREEEDSGGAGEDDA